MATSKEMGEVQENLTIIESKIRSVLNLGSKEDLPVRVIAVSKTVMPEKIRLAYEVGVRDFGENKIQEWLLKKDELPHDIRWHLIGRIQTNKVKKIVGSAYMIHSIDRLELIEELEKQLLKKPELIVNGLLQLNISKEESKSGFDLEEVADVLKEIAPDSRIRFCGVMTIGPNTDDVSQIRSCFVKARKKLEELRALFPSLGPWNVLSMGMSGDYPIAVEEGATHIRIGAQIFGKRSYEVNG